VVDVAVATDVSSVEVALEHTEIMYLQVVSNVGKDASLDTIHSVFQNFQVSHQRRQNLKFVSYVNCNLEKLIFIGYYTRTQYH
jgi:hypothetical protein